MQLALLMIKHQRNSGQRGQRSPMHFASGNLHHRQRHRKVEDCEAVDMLLIYVC